MKATEIKVGGQYTAKVNGTLTTVRVDGVDVVPGSGPVDLYSGRLRRPARTIYRVTNLRTGRQTTFRSATKFRGVAATQTPAWGNAAMDAMLLRKPTINPATGFEA